MTELLSMNLYDESARNINPHIVSHRCNLCIPSIKYFYCTSQACAQTAMWREKRLLIRNSTRKIHNRSALVQIVFPQGLCGPISCIFLLGICPKLYARVPKQLELMHLQVRLKRGDVGDLNVRRRARASLQGRAPPRGVNSGKRRRFNRCWEL